MSVQSRSDRVNTSLFEKREHIEKLHRTSNLLRKVQVLQILHFEYDITILINRRLDVVKYSNFPCKCFRIDMLPPNGDLCYAFSIDARECGCLTISNII